MTNYRLVKQYTIFSQLRQNEYVHIIFLCVCVCAVLSHVVSGPHWDMFRSWYHGRWGRGLYSFRWFRCAW